MRGGAALLVLLSHWRTAFFQDFAAIQHHRALLAPLYVLCGAGHQAVIVFFVLSGYLVGGPVMRAVHAQDFYWTHYLTQRLVRLWIVLIPALLLGALWDRLGLFLARAPALYSGQNGYDMVSDVAARLSWDCMLGNAAFLQTILVPPFGSNGPLWSLACEFWYYVMFPLGVCVAGLFTRAPWKAAIFSILLVGLLSLWSTIIWMMLPVWLLGALLYWVPSKPTSGLQRSAACAIFTAAFFALSTLDTREHWRHMILSDWTLGLMTAGFVWVLLGAQHQAKDTFGARASRFMAQFSYSLYLLHMPLLILLASFMAPEQRWLPGAKDALLSLAVLALLIGYAWLVANATERRTNAVRAWITAKLPRHENALS